ncbi:hypothetical protein DYI26_20050 [Halomonas litopenaei]|nr:hypothetical protein [Halomonas litopenaei]
MRKPAIQVPAAEPHGIAAQLLFERIQGGHQPLAALALRKALRRVEQRTLLANRFPSLGYRRCR